LVILFTNNTDTSWNEETLLLVILLPVMIMGFASLCMYSFHRKGKLFRHEQRCQYIEVSKYIAQQRKL